jgi:hypothetical protein
MSKYHYALIERRPLRSSPGEAKPLAQVIFEAENPHSATSFVLDALDALGISKTDSGMVTEFGAILRLDAGPANQPDWSSENVKVWVISSRTQSWPFSVGLSSGAYSMWTPNIADTVSYIRLRLAAFPGWDFTDEDVAAIVSVVSDTKKHSQRIIDFIKFISPIEAEVFLTENPNGFGDQTGDLLTIRNDHDRWIIDPSASTEIVRHCDPAPPSPF